jgi:hypothetical protein
MRIEYDLYSTGGRLDNCSQPGLPEQVYWTRVRAGWVGTAYDPLKLLNPHRRCRCHFSDNNYNNNNNYYCTHGYTYMPNIDI